MLPLASALISHGGIICFDECERWSFMTYRDLYLDGSSRLVRDWHNPVKCERERLFIVDCQIL